MWMLNVAATKPVVCDEAKTVNQDGGSDMADIVSVSPDSSKTVNAIDVVSETDWMPIRTDAHGRPFNIFVRPVKQCSRWKFTRVYLEIKGADEFRIRIGDVYVTDWVSISNTESVRNTLDNVDCFIASYSVGSMGELVGWARGNLLHRVLL